jgi:glyoxylase I family protein
LKNVHFDSVKQSIAKEIKYDGLHHCGVIISDLDVSMKFYIDVFSCIDESYRRPKSLPYPGAFLRFGRNEIHLIQLTSVDQRDGRPAHGGRDRHIAITVNNIDLIKERLEVRNLSFTMSMSGRRALFCRDPDGNAYEFVEDVTL